MGVCGTPTHTANTHLSGSPHVNNDLWGSSMSSLFQVHCVPLGMGWCETQFCLRFGGGGRRPPPRLPQWTRPLGSKHSPQHPISPLPAPLPVHSALLTTPRVHYMTRIVPPHTATPGQTPHKSDFTVKTWAIQEAVHHLLFWILTFNILWGSYLGLSGVYYAYILVLESLSLYPTHVHSQHVTVTAIIHNNRSEERNSALFKYGRRWRLACWVPVTTIYWNATSLRSLSTTNCALFFHLLS